MPRKRSAAEAQLDLAKAAEEVAKAYAAFCREMESMLVQLSRAMLFCDVQQRHSMLVQLGEAMPLWDAQQHHSMMVQLGRLIPFWDVSKKPTAKSPVMEPTDWEADFLGGIGKRLAVLEAESSLERLAEYEGKKPKKKKSKEKEEEEEVKKPNIQQRNIQQRQRRIYSAKAAANKVMVAIDSIQNTLRKPGSHLVPEATKLSLQQCLAECEDNLILLNRIQDGDGNCGLEMPDVKKALATAKKYEALFSATVRTYGGPARAR